MARRCKWEGIADLELAKALGLSKPDMGKDYEEQERKFNEAMRALIDGHSSSEPSQP